MYVRGIYMCYGIVLFLRDFLFIPLYQYMFFIDFGFFRWFYYVFDIFSGTRTGSKMVLGKYIGDSTGTSGWPLSEKPCLTRCWAGGETALGWRYDDDSNEEVENAGMSATQGCKSYVFHTAENKVLIRLIDTPGIGDTREINQDKKNFDNILKYIGQHQYLNGLLKPNNAWL